MTKAPAPALIALGANLGEPREALSWAKRQLAELGEIVAASRLYRTAPVGGPPNQPDYLNTAVALRTALSPRELLHALLDIERAGGRERRERWGPRTLDLDLLAYGDTVLNDPDLTLPHPRMLSRAFVLAPLSEVAPDWRHPLSGLTPPEALAPLDLGGVEPRDDPW